MDKEPEWWRKEIISQIYPRSFQDSNGDGIGDLPGIIRRLDYLKALGINAVWISPFYRSPMRDFGYDIQDYCDIDPQFGTMNDFDSLLATAHQMAIKVIIDFVPNHTAYEHPWFEESRSNRNNPKRDWYVWADPGPGSTPGAPVPPNNWLSMFGGSAWAYDETTGQYYLHTFLREQPDLNWRNPALKAAMFEVMRFWLDKGVDGFRVDVVYALAKDPDLRDDPPNPCYQPGMNPYEALKHVHSLEHPDVHQILKEMRKVVESYDGDRVLIGETFHLATLKGFMSYYGDADQCHLPFNFQLIVRPWDPRVIRTFIAEYEELLPPNAWPNFVLGNHDQHRIATRAGSKERARVAQMLLLTLRGTPTCYYGDEIGMTNVPIPPGCEQDPYGKRVQGEGRDPVRTPMQWDASPYAGFAHEKPWLPVASDYEEVNVAVQWHDPTSMLALFRELVTLRQATPALNVGSFSFVESGHEDVLAYIREHEGDRFLVVLNFSAENRVCCSLESANACEVLLSTFMDRTGIANGAISLRPDEGIVARL